MNKQIGGIEPLILCGRNEVLTPLPDFIQIKIHIVIFLVGEEIGF